MYVVFPVCWFPRSSNLSSFCHDLFRRDLTCGVPPLILEDRSPRVASFGRNYKFSIGFNLSQLAGDDSFNLQKTSSTLSEISNKD
jgi:hypothetical protein